MKAKLKKYNKKFIPILISTLVSIPTLIFNKYAIDILLFSSILILSCGIFYLSFKSKHKILLKIVALYIFCNFILFPFIYLALLKFDKKSFQVDSNIFASEKSAALEDIEDIYDPKTLRNNLIPLGALISDTSKIIDTSIQFLNDGNIISLTNFILSKGCIEVPFDRPMYKGTFNICAKNGHQITFLKDEDEGCNLGDGKESIRKYLVKSRDKISKMLQNFDSESRKIILKNDIWTYKQILPYSINIFSTSNMTPKGRVANIVFHFHQFFVATILIGLLVSFFQISVSYKKT